MTQPNYSNAAVARYPAPVREHYFTDADYAAARKRRHDNRDRFDKNKRA
jgi:hypothetical protein